MNIECVIDSKSEIGEGALWDHRAQRLWWVDIPKGHIYRYDPSSDSNETFEFGEPVGCVAPRESGGLVLAAKSGFWLYDPDTGERKAICDPESDIPENRFNDGGTDRQGRFWAGTMHDEKPSRPQGAFYRLDSTLQPGEEATKDPKTGGPLYKLDERFRISPEIHGFHTTNGLAFSPDGKTMYVAESHRNIRTVWAYDYDPSAGMPSGKRVFFDCHGQSARPDGATVDSDGCYWLAGIDGWQLLRITPRGELDRVVDMPIQRPSKPMFGGPSLDTLYVTSLGIGLDRPKTQPQAGGLFAITGLGVSGVPEVPFKW